MAGAASTDYMHLFGFGGTRLHVGPHGEDGAGTGLANGGTDAAFLEAKGLPPPTLLLRPVDAGIPRLPILATQSRASARTP